MEKHIPQYGIAFDDCKEHRRKTQCQRTHREHIPKGHIQNVAPRNTPKNDYFLITKCVTSRHQLQWQLQPPRNAALLRRTRYGFLELALHIPLPWLCSQSRVTSALQKFVGRRLRQWRGTHRRHLARTAFTWRYADSPPVKERTADPEILKAVPATRVRVDSVSLASGTVQQNRSQDVNPLKFFFNDHQGPSDTFFTLRRGVLLSGWL